METPLEHEVAHQNLAKAFDCREKAFRALLQHAIAEEEQGQRRGGDFNDVVASTKPIEVAIERLLAFNALTVVGSDGGVGKTVHLYRMAEAATNGTLFGGQLRTVKGNVLLIQKDESASNLAQKQARMQ